MSDCDKEIVSRICRRLELELGEERFDVWFGAGARFDWTGEALSIVADTTFRAERLRKNLLTEIQKAVHDELGDDAVVEFRVDAACGQAECVSEPNACDAVPGPAPTRARAGSSPTDRMSTPEMLKRSGTRRSAPANSGSAAPSAARGRPFAQLQTLVRGSCNQVAANAAEMVLRTPGQLNPLFLCGPSGVGKTHLLEGIWTEVRRRGGRRVIYLSSEQFTTYFLQALRGSGLPSFRQKYRAVDLLILDDVQFFVGKQATITELHYTIDALIRESRQIVMAADRTPAELNALGSELQNRLLGGLVCPLQPLDRATRTQVLAQLVVQRTVPIGPELLERIAERAPGDARQLIGALNRIWATSEALRQPISLALVDEILDELFPHATSVIKLDDIQRVVCDEFGIDPQTLRSDQRSRRVSYPRMLAMWLARKYTQAALTEIGDFFGRRSHSTVVSAQHKVEGWVSNGQQIDLKQQSCDVRAVLTRLERSLRA